MVETLTVSLWRGGDEGRYQDYSVPQRAEPDRARCRDLCAAPSRSDAVLSLRLPGRHVRLVRHDGERPPALDLPHPCVEGRDRRRLEIGPLENLPVIKDLAVDMTPVLREVAGRQGRVRAVEDARTSRSSASGPTAQRAWPPTPRSNASIAASAMRPAIRCAGTPIISARPRSTAPGRWSTISATRGKRGGLRRWRPTAAAMPATRTSPARSTARKRSTRPRRSPASSGAPRGPISRARSKP